EVLTPEMERLAPVLCVSLSGMPFTLAGGTALALQLGHRISVDFDWFCPEEALPFRLGGRFASLGLGLTPIQDTAHTFECLLAGVRCSFFSFRPRFEPPSVSLHRMPLAPVMDIGAMKLVAISQRGARKDFHDLFEVLTDRSLADIAHRLRAMYTDPSPNPVHIAKSLVYFVDAEHDPEPRMLRGAQWAEVKAYFTRHAREYTDTLIEKLAPRTE
ncbi:MAG: nucleotidyl transferase AbiEii/AbiGii toxin family protein, partial [Gammaproteobacteria bacterium]